MTTGKYDEEFDFVVVGSGGGSMCSALVMRAAGKSVVILEKTDLVGGTTARSGGVMWIPNNPLMAKDGVEDSYEKSMAYMDATAGQSANAPGASRDRRSAYVTEGPKMVDFLLAQGVKLRRVSYWPDYYDERPGGSAPGRTVVAELFNVNELGPWKEKLRPNFLLIPASLDESLVLSTFNRSWAGRMTLIKVGLRGMLAMLTGKHWVTAGNALQGRMLHAAVNSGADIRINSPVSTLIVEGDAVKGVVTQRDGREWRIGARHGVLINAGGFAHNQEMRDQYQPGTSIKWTATAPGDTGEMIREMMRIGAATAQMDEMVGHQAVIPPGMENKGNGVDVATVGGQLDINNPHSIVVDQSGVRYMNEGGSYMEFCKNMYARDKVVPAVPSWWIVDSTFMKTYLFCNTFPGTQKPKAWYDAGFLKQADSIEELARLINVEPATLKATVERFNADARAGKDTEFHRGDRAYDNWLGDPVHKPSKTLAPIETAPFYASQVVPGDVGTYGGVVTDVHARVLRGDGSIIPGLYATGISTASVMGRYYPGAGSSIGPSFVWGYVAAKHAANASNTLG